ncbi:hypothetical protein K440DRAFT_643297 [Wilcoxina mikolae CBS 423.85]|nr:hypothetical protein K440DRAFT_643297 [Wilcoxina mikolae CBS 423.85]
MPLSTADPSPYASLTHQAASDLSTLCSIQKSIESAQHLRMLTLNTSNPVAMAAHKAQLAADRRFLKTQHELHLLREEQRRENFAVLHKRASNSAEKLLWASAEEKKKWEEKERLEGEKMEKWKKEMKEIREEAVRCYLDCEEKVKTVLEEVGKEVEEEKKGDVLVKARGELFRKLSEGPLERSRKLLERLDEMRGRGLIAEGK